MCNLVPLAEISMQVASSSSVFCTTLPHRGLLSVFCISLLQTIHSLLTPANMVSKISDTAELGEGTGDGSGQAVSSSDLVEAVLSIS